MLTYEIQIQCFFLNLYDGKLDSCLDKVMVYNDFNLRFFSLKVVNYFNSFFFIFQWLD